MTAIELISDAIIPLVLTDKVSIALKLMDENRISHLPVVDQNKFQGIISDDILLVAENDNDPIAGFSSYFKRYYVNQSEHYYAAMRNMSDQKLSIIPVIDDANNYLGSITGEDLLVAITEILSVKNPGGIIILDVAQNDFSLAEIARLVESNDTKILSTGVRSVPGSANLQVTLKLNKMNIEPVIQTFNRFEYIIDAYFGDNQKDEELLRERYNSLIQYLNV